MAAKNFALLLLLVVSAVSALRIGSNGSAKEKFGAPRLFGDIIVTDVGAYPYAVPIFDISSPNYRELLGQGVIISKYYVLCTASTVDYIEKMGSDISALLLIVSNTIDVSNTSNGVQHKVTKALKHPDFDSGTIVNDLALIKVCPGFLVSKYAILPSVNDIFDESSSLSIVGWSTPEGQSQVKTSTNLVPATACSKISGITDYREFNSLMDFCTTVDMSFANFACGSKDNGIGLFISDKVIGISSVGGCVVKADTQTQVVPYLKWINDNMV